MTRYSLGDIIYFVTNAGVILGLGVALYAIGCLFHLWHWWA